VLLVLNHGFRALTGRLGWRLQGAGYRALFWLLTFGSVTACWVFFRADSLAAATDILYAMSGARGITLPGAWQGALGFLPPTIFAGDFDGGMQLAWSAALLGIAILAPNTACIMGAYRIGYDSPPHSGRRLFRLHPAYALVMGLAAWLCLIRMASGSSSFIYYNF